MLNQTIVDILVRRIRNGEFNPITNEPISLDDIKIPEYREAVEAILGE